jgi:hypothetical protein
VLPAQYIKFAAIGVPSMFLSAKALTSNRIRLVAFVRVVCLSNSGEDLKSKKV